MNSESNSSNLERLTNMGYDLVTSQKYLELCDNNLDKTIELLLSDPSIEHDINIDISKLTRVITDNTKYKSDRSHTIKKMLEKFSDDKEEINNALEQSNGSYKHAKIILDKSMMSDTDSDLD